MASCLSLQFLGSPEIYLDGNPIALDRRRAIALLAYLAVNDIGHTRRKYSREALSGLFWPNTGQASAFSNLRHTIWVVHQALGENWLLADRETVQLNPYEEIDLDVARFQGLLSQASRLTILDQRIPLLVDCTKLYRNHFLAGFNLKDSFPFNEWSYAESEELRRNLAGALTQLIDSFRARHQAESAIPYARRLIALDPVNEGAHRQLMEIYLEAGQHNAALKQYQTCEQILRKELNLDPQPETRALYKRIRKREIRPVHSERPLEVITPRHNLPSQVSSFIGREKEQGEIIQLLSKNRLVTLAGVGGIGKTRLALQIGNSLLDDYPDGIWFVPLDSLIDPELVPQTLASAMGIREGSSSQSLLERLFLSLHSKNTILILDNCEHLLDACVDLIQKLLHQCPDLKIIATSREILKLTGEATFYLPVLSLPEQNIVFEKLMDYESIRLFTERATLSQSSFEMTDKNAPAIVDICRILDGIPLAIELTAALVNILKVEEIAKQLHKSFALLSNEQRTSLSRHQTLQASLDWSWSLLTDSEQVFMGRLSVFAGGWTLEAAEAVCDANALYLTGKLIQKSLIKANQEQDSRYYFHEIVRQYARGKLLETEDMEALLNQHLAYFLNLVEQSEPELYRSNQVFWFNKLDRERDNLRLVLEWALAKDVASGLQIASVPWRFWERHDYREWGDRLQQLLERYPKADSLRSQALAVLSASFFAQGNMAAARKCAEQALQLARALSDPKNEAFSLLFLGKSIAFPGDYHEGIPLLEQSRDIYRVLGDKIGQAMATGWMGVNHTELEKSNSLLRESLILHRELGHLSGIAFCLAFLGYHAILVGNFSSPRPWLEEARTLYHELGDQPNEVDVLQGLGVLADRQGDYQQAYSYFEQSIALYEKTGDSRPSWPRVRMGHALLREGKITQARVIFEMTIQEFQKDGASNGVVYTIEGLASMYVNQGQLERATRLFAWADARREEVGNHRPPIEQIDVDKDMTTCLTKLSEDAFSAAYEAGQNMSLDEAVDYAFPNGEQLFRDKATTDSHVENLALIHRVFTGEKPTKIVTPPHNLPSQISSFIGREKEQEEVIKLLTKNRLVTIAGVGGIGKTRLVLQIGKKLLHEYQDGVWFVPLDSLSDPALVPQTVAAVFGIREGSSDQPVLERLTFSLHGKTILLLLDNCEHLIEACVQLIRTLLQNCPGLKVITTSRETLNIIGEAIYYLPPLSLPDQNTLLEKLADYESVQLFTERAALNQTSFKVTEQNAPAIMEICRKVDGIPMAIELAAARVDILLVEEILKQLNHSSTLLVRNSRTALSRHHSIQASMDWSWGLLCEDEKTFLNQLSVFAGGWTLESAQAVCDGDVLGLTSALVKKSLVMVDRKSEGNTRYRFHETVRQYMQERLIESGTEEVIRTRQLKYFLQLSERAELALRGITQIQWHTFLNDERDNIRAALGWANQTDLESGLFLTGNLQSFWESLDLSEGLRWLYKFLDQPESKSYPHARAKALCAQAMLLFWAGEFDLSHESAQEGLDLSRVCGDPFCEIDGLLLAAISHYNNWNSESQALYQQALDLSKSLGDQWRQAWILARFPRHVDFPRCIPMETEAVSLFKKVGDIEAATVQMMELAYVEMLNGNPQTAQILLKQVVQESQDATKAEMNKEVINLDDIMTLSQKVRNKNWLSTVLQDYGRIAFACGDSEEAYRGLQKSIEICRETGDRIHYSWSRAFLGYLFLQQGNMSGARDIFVDTIHNFQKDQIVVGVVFSLEGMASYCVMIGQHLRAARIIGCADATRKEINDPRPRLEQADVDKTIAACIAKMGEVAFSDFYDAGQKMTLDEAVAYALEKN